jgi:hypothetical protein
VTADPLAPLLDLPGVPEAVDAARAAVDALLKERVLRTRRPQVRAAALSRAAAASHALDGAGGTAADLDGSLRVLSEVRSASLVWGRAPLQALARLHTLAAAGLGDEELLGRPRDDGATSARLSQLADVVTSSRVPGLVVAAVVHGELLALAPFPSANGLVARAAQRLVLVQRGVDPDALTVPEEGLLQLGVERYRQAAEEFAAGSPAGLTDWLVLVAASVQRGAAVGREICAELAG